MKNSDLIVTNIYYNYSNLLIFIIFYIILMSNIILVTN